MADLWDDVGINTIIDNLMNNPKNREVLDKLAKEGLDKLEHKDIVYAIELLAYTGSIRIDELAQKLGSVEGTEVHGMYERIAVISKDIEEVLNKYS